MQSPLRLGSLLVLMATLGACSRSPAMPPEPASQPPTGAKVQLLWHPQPGDKRDMTIDVKQQTTAQQQDHSQITHQPMLLKFGYEVKEVDAKGVVSVDMTFLRIKGADTDGNDGDSEGPQRMGLNIAFRAVVGRVIHARYSPRGEILEINGLAGIPEAMVAAEDATGEYFLPEEKTIAVERFREQFGEDVLRESFATSTGFYPDKPVDNGDTWQQTVNLSVPVPMTVTLKYKLLDHDATKMTVAVMGTMMTASGGAMTKEGRTTAKVTLSGQQTGTVEVEADTGWPIKMDVHQDLSGSMEISSPSDGTKTVKLVVTSDAAMTTE